MEDEISAKIREVMTDAVVVVQLDGNRALIEVVSRHFDGLSRVKQQQAVYSCIDEYISDGRLHAVTIKASIPNS